MTDFRKIKLTVVFALLLAMLAGFWQSGNVETSKTVAARYQVRSRSADFFARSTNNPTAKYSGHIRSSGGRTTPQNQSR